MVMNGKEGVGKGYEWNTDGSASATLLSERRLGTGQAWGGKKARAPRRWV